MMRSFLFALLALYCCASACADAPIPVVGRGSINRLALFPSQLIPPRNVDVWLPDGYPKDAPYAVLYMHDGQMLFDAAATWNKQEWRADEVAGELIRSGKTRPFIIVGIWNGDPARHSEYYPQKPFAALPAAKQAELLAVKRDNALMFPRPVDSDRYLKFLVTELKPAIDRQFAVATDRANTVIMGSSMGGLISMYALSEYPAVFGAAACLSTHWAGMLVPDDTLVQQSFFDYLQHSFPAPGAHRVYFDRGDQTLDAWYPALQDRADAILRARGYGPGWMLSLVFPGADHSEIAWGKRLHIPMQFLLPPRM